MTPIRIILADDHSLIREGFKAILGQSDRFVIVAEPQNGVELVEFALSTKPDVILTDLSMPRMNGFEAMDEIRKADRDVKFVILTMHEEREYILRAIKAGASGYLLKNTERIELEHAIITVHEGGKYFSPSINNILAEAVLRPDGGEVGELTAREKEVLELVANGHSTKQIADMLKISIRTVESHRINMLKKMKVNNSAELIRKALELKLL
ncbi:response regulator transcription factor [Chryseolinea sp. T2]|uniref:response regulator transcription factor n=1 Tax=Chryseolinea sp. T2 TaxID=3129255 RepID=UPI003077A058